MKERLEFMNGFRSDQAYKAVINSGNAIYHTDRNGGLIFYNRLAAEIWGKSPVLHDPVNAPEAFLKWYNRDGTILSRDQHPVFRVLQSGSSFHNEVFFIERQDQTRRKIMVNIDPLFYAAGDLTGVINIVDDITAQQSDNIISKMTAMVETSDDAIISKTLDDTIVHWNNGAYKLFGYTPKEVLGKAGTILIPQAYRWEDDQIRGKINCGNVHHLETRRKTKAGLSIPVLLTVIPIRNSGGDIIGTTEIMWNIGEKIKLEEKQAMLAAIIDSSDDAIISKNLDGIIMSWNKGAMRIFGYNEDEIIGKPVTTLIPQSRLAEEDIILGKIRKGERVHHFVQSTA